MTSWVEKVPGLPIPDRIRLRPFVAMLDAGTTSSVVEDRLKQREPDLAADLLQEDGSKDLTLQGIRVEEGSWVVEIATGKAGRLLRTMTETYDGLYGMQIKWEDTNKMGNEVEGLSRPNFRRPTLVELAGLRRNALGLPAEATDPECAEREAWLRSVKAGDLVAELFTFRPPTYDKTASGRLAKVSGVSAGSPGWLGGTVDLHFQDGQGGSSKAKLDPAQIRPCTALELAANAGALAASRRTRLGLPTRATDDECEKGEAALAEWQAGLKVDDWVKENGRIGKIFKAHDGRVFIWSAGSDWCETEEHAGPSFRNSLSKPTDDELAHVRGRFPGMF